MKIREITDGDIPACMNIYNWYVRETTVTFDTSPMDREEYARRIRKVTARYPWIVLESEKRVIGYAHLSPFSLRSAYRFMADVTVYLDPEFRGKGYGRILMMELEALAKEAGYQKLISVITAENKASVSMHEKLGYQKLMTMRNAGYKMGRWLDVLWFAKDIAAYENPPQEIQKVTVREKTV